MAENTMYSLETTVVCIKDFYDFIVRMHAEVDACELEQLPPGGWPQITHDGFRKLGFNDTVIDLLRHPLYFGPGQCERPDIMHETWPINWADLEMINHLANLDPDTIEEDPKPCHHISYN
jgi:hypothetical protein